MSLYQRYKSYFRNYYQEHKEELRACARKWYAEHKKRKEPMQCVICGAELPYVHANFKYCDKCVEEGRTSRQVRHLRRKRSAK